MGNSHESFTPENIQKGHVNIIFCSFQYQIKNTTFKCKMELNVDPLGPKVIPWLHQLIASLCKAGYFCVFHHLPERCCQVTGTRVPQCCYSYASFPWWSLPAQKQQMPGTINLISTLLTTCTILLIHKNKSSEQLPHRESTKAWSLEIQLLVDWKD